jgi:hypothetical protein
VTRSVRVARSARIALAVTTILSLGACADTHDLRAQQAAHFKRRCLSFAIRAGVSRVAFEKLERIPRDRFLVGGGIVHGGVDSLEPCRTIMVADVSSR